MLFLSVFFIFIFVCFSFSCPSSKKWNIYVCIYIYILRFLCFWLCILVIGSFPSPLLACCLQPHCVLGRRKCFCSSYLIKLKDYAVYTIVWEDCAGEVTRPPWSFRGDHHGHVNEYREAPVNSVCSNYHIRGGTSGAVTSPAKSPCREGRYNRFLICNAKLVLNIMCCQIVWGHSR